MLERVRASVIRFAICLLLSTLGMVMPAGAQSDETSLQIGIPPGGHACFERIEVTVDGLGAGGNPFDPDSMSLDIEVTSPSGKSTRVPGFFLREFEQKLDGGRERLTSRGEGNWRVRWLPVEPGRHMIEATSTIKGKRVGHGIASIDVLGSERHGVARIEPVGRRYFCMDDGTPLFLNGLCACWHGARGTADYDDWLAAYEKAGINYIRIWMWPEAFGIEWDRGDKLRYRLDSAWRLDRVLADAERKGIFVMLCLDYHGIFETKPDYWGGNNYWPRHPYNATNGGPCAVQNDFFTNEEAKTLYAKRLRYIVARWSAFPNLLAWEFFNEIDNEYAYIKHADVVTWHRDLARRLRQMDPCRHLISSSFTGGSERGDLYALPEIDFAQYHSYNANHPARMMAEKTARFFELYHKPFFVSEYGTDWRGWKPDTDPHFRALHQAIWSGAFTGAAGTGMTWWWENIHTAQLYPHWSALSGFLKGTGIGRAEMHPARVESAGGVEVFGVSARNEALIWVLDVNLDWPDGAQGETAALKSGAAVTLKELEDGPWSVEWWDTLAGRCVDKTKGAAVRGSLRLEVPDFRADIAARARRE
jgi:hypothetical protein